MKCSKKKQKDKIMKKKIIFPKKTITLCLGYGLKVSLLPRFLKPPRTDQNLWYLGQFDCQ